MLPLAEGLGSTAQPGGEVFRAALSKFGGLPGGVAPAILLASGGIAGLHRLPDSGTVRQHRPVLAVEPLKRSLTSEFGCYNKPVVSGSYFLGAAKLALHQTSLRAAAEPEPVIATVDHADISGLATTLAGSVPHPAPCKGRVVREMLSHYDNDLTHASESRRSISGSGM